MQKLLKGNLTQKIILILIIAILCNFAIPNYSQAADAGILLDPIKMLVAFVGDVVVSAVNRCFTGEWIDAAGAKAQGTASDWEDYWQANTSQQIDWPTILVSPQEIFTGKVLALNVNFLREIKGNTVELVAGENATSDTLREALLSGEANTIGTEKYEGELAKLREQIAQWYILIRNLAAAALFCVLIYIGIRMVISSVSEERAKYKSMMVNWVVAIALVFFLHYLMSTIMFVTEKMVNIIGNGLTNEYTIIRPGTEEGDANYEEKFKLKVGAKIGNGNVDNLNEDAKVYNLLELVRVYVSLDNRGLAFAYLLVYLVLVVYTFIFIFKYLKRFVYMAFLTMIAPVIAFTYPIDKMKDGSAQAFNAWFREYLFNALLQPVHLLIYVVLIGTAVDLVQANFIYTIVALYFINKAEDIIKGFFGFDKAKTAGGGAGAFAKGALASQALNKIKSSGSAAKSIGSKSSGGSGSSGSKPRQAKGLDAYINSDNKAKLNTSDSNNKSSKPFTNSPEELGSESKTKDSKQEYQEKFGTLDNSELPNGENVDTNKKVDRNEAKEMKREAKQAKRKAKQEKRKIKLGNNKKTRRGAVGGMVLNAAKYSGKKIGRGAIRTAAAASGALLGGAMAIATGNSSYLAAGAGIGYALGGKAADAPKNVVNSLGKGKRAIQSSYRKERLGAQGAAGKARYDEFKKNEDNIKYFKEEYGVSTKEAKAMVEQGRDFIEAGYTNPEDVDRLMKMQNSFGDATSDQIMAADQSASNFGTDYFMDDKKISTLEESSTKAIMAEAAKKGHTIDESSARKMAQKHINLMAKSKGMPSVDFEAKRKRDEASAKKAEAEAKKAEASAKRTDDFQQAMIDFVKNNNKPKKGSSGRKRK